MKSKLGVFTLLGAITAAASMISLVSVGFRIGWVTPLHLMLDYYEGLTHLIFGWAEPFMGSVIGMLNNYFHWHLRLFPYWKHVFIPMWLYFLAVPRGIAPNTIKEQIGRNLLLIHLPVGGLVAALAAMIVGTSSYSSSMTEPQADYLLLAAPCASLIAFWATVYWLVKFAFISDLRRYFVPYAVSQLALPLIVTLTFIVAPDLLSILSSKLQVGWNPYGLFLALFTISLAIGPILGGYLLMYRYHPNSRHPSVGIWVRSKWSVRTGYTMGIAITATALFVVTNAGLKLVGL